MNAKLLLTACPLLLLTLACSGGSSPTEPNIPSRTQGLVQGWVFAERADRQCVRDARIQIVDGPGAGTTVLQELWTCDEAVRGETVGFSFRGLPLGRTVRLRAFAPGFLQQELEATVAVHPVQVTFYLTPDWT